MNTIVACVALSAIIYVYKNGVTIATYSGKLSLVE